MTMQQHKFAPLRALALGLFLAPLAAPAAAWVKPQEPSAPAASEGKAQKLEAWPEAPDETALKRSCAKVRKASTDEMEAAGRLEVEAAGAAAAPFLLKSLAREKNEDTRERLEGALDLVTDVSHTRLLAESLDSKSDYERRYVLARLAMLGDPGLRERAEGLAQGLADRLGDPKKAKKVETIDVELTALFTLSTGSPAGLGTCLALGGSKAWPQWRDALRGAATSAKKAGDEVARALVAALRPSEASTPNATVAALRLIAYAGTKDHARSILPALDNTANHVKVAAVNALRMIVDGEEPIDKLSTFDAIERANKWKARL